ncbi:MAG TPA: hypothetical protein VEB21_11460, partial [Terriglobales bacterium]|nr:hypothetical protein [Terriglobales bacterium]
AISGDVDLEVAAGNLQLGYVAAAGTARLRASGDIADASGDGGADVAGSVVDLDAGGAIGPNQRFVELIAERLTATATGAIYLVGNAGGLIVEEIEAGGDLWLVLDGAGDLIVDRINAGNDTRLYAYGGDVRLGTAETAGRMWVLAADSILNDETTDVTNLTASAIELQAVAGHIGIEASPVRVITSSLTATANDGIALASTEDLSLGAVRSASGAIALSADGDILNTLTGAATNLLGGDSVHLIALGDIGTSNNAIRIGTDARVSARHGGDLYLRTSNRDLNLAATESEQGWAYLSLLGEGDLSADSVTARGLHLRLQDGDAAIDTVATGELDAVLAGEGRELSIAQLLMSARPRGVSVQADRLSLLNVQSGRAMTFSLLGNDGGIADSIEVLGSIRGTARFSELYADQALVDVVRPDARQSRIAIRRMIVLTGATVRTSSIAATIGSGDATPFRLQVGRRAVSFPRRSNRVIEVVPRTASLQTRGGFEM